MFDIFDHLNLIQQLIKLMAEIVELRLENGVNELEQLERIGLFSNEEIKTIVNKRKAFEYRLQRPKRTKEDYLKYINYEESLLKLIKRRRDKIGYQHKYKEIEYFISLRVSTLFRRVIAKHQGDVDLSFDYINFRKSVGLKENLSAIYARMLQIHNSNPNVWIAAAKWEFEDNCSPDSARALLQRGLRYNPESRFLWNEYFKMELMYSERIIRRKEILEGKTKKRKNGMNYNKLDNLINRHFNDRNK